MSDACCRRYCGDPRRKGIEQAINVRVYVFPAYSIPCSPGIHLAYPMGHYGRMLARVSGDASDRRLQGVVQRSSSGCGITAQISSDVGNSFLGTKKCCTATRNNTSLASMVY